MDTPTVLETGYMILVLTGLIGICGVIGIIRNVVVCKKREKIQAEYEDLVQQKIELASKMLDKLQELGDIRIKQAELELRLLQRSIEPLLQNCESTDKENKHD